ncbi:MAG TPA: hypothetical protein VGG77_12170 [Roseiarcus sp.]|jgi:hypothetical protein
MVREVRSPNSLERDQHHPQRVVSPGAYSNPGNAHADWGHVAHNLGKGGHRPASARRDKTPVQGGYRDPGDCNDRS